MELNWNLMTSNLCSSINKDGSVCLCKAVNTLPTQFPKMCQRHVKTTTTSVPLCSICLNRCRVKISLQCKHAFCFHCIYKWSSVKHSCPCCRNEINGTFVKIKETFKMKFSEHIKTMKAIDTQSISHAKKSTIAFFKFICTNYKVISIMDGNVPFLDVCIIKYKQLSSKYELNDDRILKKMIVMNERFKENTFN